MRTYIPATWPSPQTINSLVQKASGQFIYASTVIRYVDSAQHRPVERLDAVLRISNPVGDLISFAELDCVYRHVFASVHNIKTVLRILGALLFGQRLHSKKSASGTMELAIPITDPRFLEELLSLNRGDVYFALGDLHSIINVPDPRRNSNSTNSKASDAGIRILHSSLNDFLTDRSRAGRYFINSVKVHADLAQACTRNLLSGKRSRCSLTAFDLICCIPTQGHKFVHQYSGQALVTHCRYSVLTHELLNGLLSFDLSIWMTTCKTWNDGGGPFDKAWTELPHLFQWFRSQACFLASFR